MPKALLSAIHTRGRRVSQILVSEAFFEFDTCPPPNLTWLKGRQGGTVSKRVPFDDLGVHLQVHDDSDILTPFKRHMGTRLEFEIPLEKLMHRLLTLSFP